MQSLMPLFVPVCFIVISLVAAEVYARRRHIPRKEFLALGAPKLVPSVILILGYIAFTYVRDVAEQHAGLGENSWVGRYSGSTLAIRTAAIALLAPLAEELLFRGAIFKVALLRLGAIPILASKSTALAILMTAALFAGFHLQYSWVGMAFVFTGGLYYGVARAWSGSTWLAFLLHCAGNSLTAYQLLHN